MSPRKSSKPFFEARTEHTLVVALRISLGLIFVWFGALKVAGYNPVYDIVEATFPVFATPNGNIVLGLIETLIGLGLLTHVVPEITHALLLAHLAGTLSVFLIAPDIVFEPYFPVLTLAGEFVFKNTALALAGLVVLGAERHSKRRAFLKKSGALYSFNSRT